MDATLFGRFQSLAYRKAGIDIKPGKESLVEARVGKRLRALQLDTPAAYLDFLQADESGEELVQFLDAISTNFTYFFRESDHFTALAQQAQSALARGQRRFRCWSAASSSGEEPYSILITLAEAFGGEAIDYKLLATDISTTMLNAASAGVYASKTVARIEPRLRSRYLNSMGGDRFQVVPALRERVVFKRLNLSQPPFPFQGPLDVVFCRNVMIYFDQAVRQRLISAIDDLLAPGGLLMIGHTETLTGIRSNLKMLRPSLYRKPEAA